MSPVLHHEPRTSSVEVDAVFRVLMKANPLLKDAITLASQSL